MDIKLAPKEYGQKSSISRGFRLPSMRYEGRFNFFYFFKKDNLWLGLAVGLLIVSILVYAGLIIYKNSLNKKKFALESQIESKGPERDLKLEKQIKELDKGIINLEKFSEIHIYSSRLFQILEGLTLPKVQWSNFTVDLSGNEISLRGQAIDYNTLAKEIIVLENDSRIKKAEVSGIALDSFGVGFNMILEFEPNVLKGPLKNK